MPDHIDRCCECDCELDALYREFRNDRFCEDCFQEITFVCCECGDRYYRENVEMIGPDGETSYCSNCYDDCFAECDDCGEMTSRCNMSRLGDSQFCESCYEDFPLCQECGRRVFDRETFDYDQELCPRCSSRSGGIRDYSFKPTAVCRYTAKQALQISRIRRNRLYFGVEVEMECKQGVRRGDVAKRLVDETGSFFYCKNDGSLSGNGFEAVTHPFTFDWMKENGEVFEKLFECQKDAKSFTTSNCGMHVHMSRRAFTPVHLFKFSKFFYDNPDFVYRISGRQTEDELNRYASPYIRGRSLTRIVSGRSEQGSRNKAINFYSGSTIECRIFKGTISRRRFYANVEFLHGLYEFTSKENIPNICVTRFMAYMQIHKKEYPYFFLKWRPFKTIIESTTNSIEVMDVVDKALGARSIPFSMYSLDSYLENVMDFIHGVNNPYLSELPPRRAQQRTENFQPEDQEPELPPDFCNCEVCRANRLRV